MPSGLAGGQRKESDTGQIFHEGWDVQTKVNQDEEVMVLIWAFTSNFLAIFQITRAPVLIPYIIVLTSCST